MMHILAVSDYILEDGVVCGATRVLHGYLTELHKRGAKISLMSLAKGQYEPIEKKEIDYTIYRVSKLTAAIGGFPIKAATFFNEPINLVLCHLPFSASFLIDRQLLRSKHTTLVYIFHSPWHLEFNMRYNLNASNIIKKIWFPVGSTLRKITENYIVRQATKIVTLSNYMCNTLIKVHASSVIANLNKKIKNKILEIPPGVDTKLFCPGNKDAARYKLGLSLDRLIAFTVRGLIPRSGISLALQALARIKWRYPQLLLLIGGEGPLRKSLENEAAKLALNNIKFLGEIPEEKLPLYYQAADFFILPTLDLEGFGLVILEAWASGIPVLGTPVGAIPEILSSITPDFLLPDTKSETLAHHLSYMAENPLILPEIGAKCREHAIRNYSWVRSCSLLLEGLRLK